MSWADLVPQIFYDGIARFTAGFALSVSAIGIFWAPLAIVRDNFLTAFTTSVTTTSFGFLLAFYVIALVLEGLRHSQNKESYKRIFKKESEIWKNCSDSFKEIWGPVPILKKPPNESLAIDAIRLVCPGAGSRLVKLRAEISLCRNLRLGWILIFTFSLLYIPVSYCCTEALPKLTVLSYIGIFAVFIGAIGAWSTCRHLSYRHCIGLYNHWLLLIHPKATLVLWPNSESPAAAHAVPPAVQTTATDPTMAHPGSLGNDKQT